MKSTFANARENLSDEQLKHVTGGARVNSRPETHENHLVDQSNLDLHAADAADGHLLVPPKQATEPGAAELLERIAFSQPLSCPWVRDDSGDQVPVSAIYVWETSEGIKTTVYAGNGDLVEELTGRNDYFLQDMVEAAKMTDDQVSITNFEAPQGLVDGRSDSGERENTTWPLPSAPDGSH